MAWLTGWNYRKRHIINEATNAGTGYQIRIRVYYGSGTDSGENVYLGGKCKTDFGDIRFTDASGNLLNYWIESKTNSDNALFWVKINGDLSSSAQLIYIYYGNSDATTTSNGASTFIFFDNFTNDRSSNGSWSNLFTESFGGKYVLSQIAGYSDAVVTLSSTVSNLGMEFRYYIVSKGTYGPRAGIRFIENGSSRFYDLTNEIGSFYNNYYHIRYFDGSTYSSLVGDGNSYSIGTWYRNYLYRYSTSGTLVAQLGASTTMSTTHSTLTSFNRIGFSTWDSGNKYYIDWIAVRKYVSPEPSHGSWGNEETSEGVTWLSGWNYRKKHVINGSTSGARGDYQVRIKVYYGSGTDSGENVYLNNKCQSDFDDLRFVYKEGHELLSYWIEEKVDSNYAIVWVKVPYIPASPNTTDIYIYYGNSNATTLSDGNNTFVDFDHFNTNTLSNYTQIDSGWSIDTSGSGILKIGTTSQGFISKSNTLSRNYALMAYVYMANSDVGIGFFWGTAGGSESSVSGYLANYYPTTTFSKVRRYSSGTFTDITSLPALSSGWVRLEFRIKSSSFQIVRDTTTDATVGDTNYTSLYGVGFRQKASSQDAVDWWALRKYVDPEPSHGSWGTEEQSGNTYSTTLSESVSFNEVLSRNPIKRVSEVMNCSDSFLKNLSMIREYFENVSLNQIANWVGMPLRIGYDTIGTYYIIAPIGKIFSELVSLSDAFYRTLSISRVLHEVATLNRMIAKAMVRTLMDTSSIVDFINRSPAKVILNALSLSDIWNRTLSKILILTENRSLLDFINRGTTRGILNALALTDTFYRQISLNRAYQETISLFDNLFRAIAIRKTETIILTRNLNKTIQKLQSEVLSLPDTIRKGVTRGLQDTLSISDSIKNAVVKVLQETLSILENVIPALPLIIGEGTIGTIYGIWYLGLTLREDISTTDSFSRTNLIMRTFTESILLTRLIAKGLGRSILESMTFADALVKGINKVILNTITSIDTFSRVCIFGRSLSETIMNADSIRKSIAKIHSESFSIIDSVARGFSKIATETLSLIDSIRKSIQKIRSESISLTLGTLSKYISSIKLESISFTDTVRKSLSLKALTETFSLVDTIKRSLIRVFQEALSLVDTAWVTLPLIIGQGTIGTIYGIWYLGVVLKEQAAITDTFSKTSILWKTLNESVSLLRVITIGSMRTLSETLSFADTLKRSLSRTLTDSVANTDIFSRIATLNKLLNETLSGSDVIRRNISRAVSETLPLIDVISKGIARVITNSLTFADVVNKSVSVIKAESIMLVRSLTKGVARLNSEVINFTDVVRKGISLKAFSEAISLIDTVKRSISRILQESISLLDTVWAILPLVIGQGTIGTIYGIWHKGLTLRESIEFSDAVASNIILSKILIENIALVSAIARSINIYRYITEQIAFNDVALKGISRKIIENVLLLSVYSKVISKRLIENLVLYSVIPFFISKSLTELIVSSDSIKKSVVRTLQESLGIPDYFLTNYIRVLSEVVYLLYDIKLPNKLILQETINLLQHNIIFGLSIDKVFSENVNISDMIGFGYFEALFELLSLSDTLKKHPNKLLYELVMEIEKRLIF